MPLPRLSAVLGSVMLFAAACGGGSSTEAGDAALDGEIVLQGDVALDEESIVSTTTTEASDSSGGGAAESGDGNTLLDTIDDIIPEEEESVEGEFFDSVGTFMGCMNVEAGGFQGVPDQAEGRDESLPKNQPSYIEALQTCAARSDIVNTMQAAEDSSRFTAEEIEERNRGFVTFRDCLIGRGWTIPEPSPDENGLLFNSYVEAATAWTAPDGESILNSDDLQECGAQGNPLGLGEGDDDETSEGDE